MDWKKMFKPDWKKVALAAALFLIASFLIGQIGAMYGFPLTFYDMAVICAASMNIECKPITSYPNLVIDVVFWYLIACILLTFMPKGRKR